MLSLRSLLLLLAVALAVAELGRGARVLAQGGCQPNCACGCQSRVRLEYSSAPSYPGPSVYEQRVRLPVDYQPAPYSGPPPAYYYPTPGYAPPAAPQYAPQQYAPQQYQPSLQYQPQPIVYPQYQQAPIVYGGQPSYAQPSFAPQYQPVIQPRTDVRVDIRAPAPRPGIIRRIICGPGGCSFR